MAGILTPQCDWVIQDVFMIFAWICVYNAIPAFGVIAATIFGGWVKYNKRYLPSLALHRWLFWGGWVVAYALTGILSWILWFYGGQWCEAWEPLIAVLLMIVPYFFWPIALFVTDNFLITWLIMAFLAIWTIIVLVLSLLYTTLTVSVVFVVIICILLFFWFIYQAIVFFLAWRCANYSLGFRNISSRFGSILSTSGLSDVLKCPNPRNNDFPGQAQPMTGGYGQPTYPNNNNTYPFNPYYGGGQPTYVRTDIADANINFA